MSRLFEESRYRGNGVTVPKIWITVALSVLIHVLALWQWKPDLRTPSDDKDPGKARGQLSVQLAPRASPSPPRPPAPQAPPLKMFEKPRPPVRATAPPPSRKSPPPAVARPQPAPPVIARNKPESEAPSRPPPAPSPARAPAEGDFASNIEARRRARNESPAPAAAPESIASAPQAEDENARANRIAAANLGTDAKPSFGADPRRGGGVFTIQRMAYDYAEFLFYGWNKDIRRNTAQVIEVRKGNDSDIRIAVVRRMIAIIRDYEQGDFVWQSPRLGRNITLSARARDNAALEAFMFREFFEDDRRR